MGDKLMILIAGPTAVGKTSTAIQIAKHFDSEIISCDSRQMYREMHIGTAVPSEDELSQVKHHFIGNLSIHDYYNVSMYEQEVLAFLNTYFQNHDVVIVTGGSGLYIDALCKGIDDLPRADLELRKQLTQEFQEKGIEWLRSQLKLLDPKHYAEVDLRNTQRILKSVEVCLQTGRPYSSFLTKPAANRDFRILKVALNRDREELTARIRLRTDDMIRDGLLQEAESLYPLRDNNALKTVGYKEIFDYIDHKMTMDEAVEKIKINTRRYAKRQITWLKRTDDYVWLHPDEAEQHIIDMVARI